MKIEIDKSNILKDLSKVGTEHASGYQGFMNEQEIATAYIQIKMSIDGIFKLVHRMYD